VARFQAARLVAARDEHQRAVELGDVVQEDGDVHGPRLGHQIVVGPGAVVLVPLPDGAVEGRLRVDLELVHVDPAVEQLLHRLDQAGVGTQPPEGLVVGMRGESRPDRLAVLLAPDLVAPLGVDARQFPVENADLLRGEAPRQEEVAFAVEFLDLCG